MRAWVVGATGVIGAAVAARFKANGYQVFKERINVLDPHEIDLVNRHEGPFDVLVNASGILGPVAPVEETNAIEWARTIEVNLIGSYLLTRQVIPAMEGACFGRIIHFSGGGAAYGVSSRSAYASSKAGLLRFVESVALELQHTGVFIYAVAPGPVKSKMNPEATDGPERAVELVEFLIGNRQPRLSGRMFSAVYDDYKHLPECLNVEAGLLRRFPFKSSE